MAPLMVDSNLAVGSAPTIGRPLMVGQAKKERGLEVSGVGRRVLGSIFMENL